MNAGKDIEILNCVETITILNSETYIQLNEAKKRLEIANTKLDELTLTLERLQNIVEYDDLPNELLNKTLF